MRIKVFRTSVWPLLIVLVACPVIREPCRTAALLGLAVVRSVVEIDTDRDWGRAMCLRRGAEDRRVAASQEHMNCTAHDEFSTAN